VNLADPAAQLKARARHYGFQVFLQPERPTGWLVLIRPAGEALRDPVTASAPTREEAVRLAARLFEQELLDQLVETLNAAGAPVPNWEPGIVWEDHIDALHAAVRAQGVSA
jgi:uncharacterized protein (DUF58 family)